MTGEFRCKIYKRSDSLAARASGGLCPPCDPPYEGSTVSVIMIPGIYLIPGMQFGLSWRVYEMCIIDTQPPAHPTRDLGRLWGDMSSYRYNEDDSDTDDEDKTDRPCRTVAYARQRGTERLQIANKSKEPCTICQDRLCSVIGCIEGHIFCLVCIQQWREMSEKKGCPSCRQPLLSTFIHSSDIKKTISADSDSGCGSGGGGSGIGGSDATNRVCSVCKAPSTKQCIRCHTVKYCGRKCQVEDWHRGHKTECPMLVAAGEATTAANIQIRIEEEGDDGDSGGSDSDDSDSDDSDYEWWQCGGALGMLW